MLSSYIAFKGLDFLPSGGLVSPVRRTKWKRSLRGEYYLYRGRDSSRGIFASTWGEAATYSENIFLVRPYVEGQRVSKISIGVLGWEADYASIIAGPWNKQDKDGQLFGAELVVRSYLAGFPQAPGILLWALLKLPTIDDLFADIIRDLLLQISQDDFEIIVESSVGEFAIKSLIKRGLPQSIRSIIFERFSQWDFLRVWHFERYPRATRRLLFSHPDPNVGARMLLRFLNNNWWACEHIGDVVEAFLREPIDKDIRLALLGCYFSFFPLRRYICA